MNVRLNKNQKIQILNANDVYSIMQQILLRQNKIRRNQEHFWVVGLDNSNTVLFVELISIGAVNRVHVSPPDVFRMGIYKLATKMILVHNHPSGNLDVSKADEDFTDKLLKVGQIIEIDVIDHLIITETDFVSFANEDIIKRLQQSGLYELKQKESEAIKAFKLQLEREEAEKKKALEIAKRLKDLGSDIEFIKKATGLGKREIGKL